MMNIILPMAGAGQRFAEKGYKIHKPVLPMVDYRTGNQYPMVVCAAMDLPGAEEDGSNIIFIDRSFHKEDGVEEQIQEYFPKSSFITVEKLTEGQACTCLLAKEQIDLSEELLIAGCDNGMIFDSRKFEEAKKTADCLVFTYRHHDAVLEYPNAYGWMKTDSEGNVTDLSIKKAISDSPMEDHAVVATFWFKRGEIFVKAAEQMIADNDRINNEFYVDETIRWILNAGLRTKVFEIEKYLGWGTPKDYENYLNTIHYWEKFVKDNRAFTNEE